jgi:hypothetical protein
MEKRKNSYWRGIIKIIDENWAGSSAWLERSADKGNIIL